MSSHAHQLVRGNFACFAHRLQKTCSAILYLLKHREEKTSYVPSLADQGHRHKLVIGLLSVHASIYLESAFAKLFDMSCYSTTLYLGYYIAHPLRRGPQAPIQGK